jgi:hypothetical protein
MRGSGVVGFHGDRGLSLSEAQGGHPSQNERRGAATAGLHTRGPAEDGALHPETDDSGHRRVRAPSPLSEQRSYQRDVGRPWERGRARPQRAPRPFWPCRALTTRPWDRVRALCATVAPLDSATSRCARATHGPKGVLSEEFGRTPVRRMPGCPEMGEGPQIACSAKGLWQVLQRLREPISPTWPHLQLPCPRAICVRLLREPQYARYCQQHNQHKQQDEIHGRPMGRRVWQAICVQDVVEYPGTRQRKGAKDSPPDQAQVSRMVICQDLAHVKPATYCLRTVLRRGLVLCLPRAG